MAKQIGIEAFESIFYRHRDMVFKTAYLITGNAQEAEDILQEVFIKVYRSGDTFNPDMGGVNTWLHRITVNQCISEKRRKSPASISLETLEEDGVDLPDTSSEHPEHLSIKQDECERIRQAMGCLDKKHRAILTLRYFDGLSYNEIAQILKIPLGTVKSRLNIATKLLHKEALKNGVNREM